MPETVITNLVFEGGGGRGMAYLGALAALEDLGILPIGGSSPITGIAGASAGSITAFMLALGYTSAELAALVPRQEYLRFLDEPAVTYLPAILSGPFRYEYGKHRHESQRRFSKLMAFLTGTVTAPLLSILLDSALSNLSPNIRKAVGRQAGKYLHNVLHEGGMFPGFSVASFFAESLLDKIKSIEDWNVLLPRADASNNAAILEHVQGPSLNSTKRQALTDLLKQVTFDSFYKWRACRLVVAGTNLTENVPGYFSQLHTPDFPIIGAVRASMSIPLMFKPVFMEAASKQDALYNGYWVDGGVLNNLPLHAFNAGGSLQPYAARFEPFNKATLGFDLKSPEKQRSDRERKNEAEARHVLNIGKLIGNLMDSFMYAGSLGQYADSAVRENVILIDTGELDTYELAPTPKQVAATLDCAWCATMQWFREHSFDGSDVEWAESPALAGIRDVLGVKRGPKPECCA